MKNSRLCAWWLGLALISVVTSRAEPPFGHPNWLPSPTNPVGFAGQGNNWYPGATPPAQWSDTTNGPAQNIRWKVPIPGWTDAPPNVIGKRVIGVYSPHHVLCYDTETGKVLWRDQLQLMTLPVLHPDGKTIVPVLDPAKAAKQQWLFEHAVALTRVHQATWLHYNGRQMLDTLDQRRPLIQYVAETIRSWRPTVAQDFPDLVPALDKDVAFYEMTLTNSVEQIKELTRDLRNGHGNFRVAAAKQLGLVALHNNWQGSISDVAATPVSDGEIVCLTMGFGQVAAYEVATGKRLWAWRHPRMNPGPVNHVASPLLWKDLLIIPAPSMERNRKTTTGRAWNQQSLMAIDKRTGAVRWETADQVMAGEETAWIPGGTHGIHESPHLMRYPLSEGRGRALVISGTGHIVDAETGVSLGQLRGYQANKPGEPNRLGTPGSGFKASLGDRVFRGSAGDNFSPTVYITQIQLTTSNTVEQIVGPTTELKPGQGPFALSDKLLALNRVVDPQTGTTLASLGNTASAIITSRHLLLADSTGHNTGPKKHDGSELLGLSVRVFDLADPAKPKLVATNLVQARGYTPDISGQYFPKFATEPSWRRWGALIPGHVNYQGIGLNFATDTAGLTAHGQRLYLHAPAWLYCIGEH